MAVSNTQAGPFKLLCKYKVPEGSPSDFCNSGIFIDSGVLVYDGKVYIFCGYERSYMAELNPVNMCENLPGTFKDDIIPVEEAYCFYEAASVRKVEDTYYFIYLPHHGSRLVYATSKSPKDPFTYRGIIIDNGIEYPGGNNHRSICKVEDHWYIFYHNMTNNTIFSRRACVERIEILKDGTIPQVKMTSLGFSKSINPYECQSTDIDCVLIGGNYVTVYSKEAHPVINNITGSILGFQNFDFSSMKEKQIEIIMSVHTNVKGKIIIKADDYTEGPFWGNCPLTSRRVAVLPNYIQKSI